MTKPVSGLNHLGLVVDDITAAKQFFTEVLELEVVEDRGELIFLKAGQDILAIKTKEMAINKPEHGAEQIDPGDNRAGWQHLDHYGFFAPTKAAVDDMVERLKKHEIEIIKGPYDRSDGRSVYFRDPCGMVGEYFFCDLHR